MTGGPANGTARRRVAQAAVTALAAALLAGCGPSPTPTPIPTPTSPATPSAATQTPEAAAAPCTATGLRAAGGPWGGAAGSRGSDVVVDNEGDAPCLLPPNPVVILVDAGGTVVRRSQPEPGTEGPELGPGDGARFSFQFSNWCDPVPPLPIRLALALQVGSLDIGGVTVATLDDLPPCNGPGQPTSLSTTAWQLP